MGGVWGSQAQLRRGTTALLSLPSLKKVMVADTPQHTLGLSYHGMQPYIEARLLMIFSFLLTEAASNWCESQW